MKLFPLTAVLSLLFIGAVMAAEPPKAMPRQLTIAECTGLLPGLIALDGHSALGANNQVVTIPYVFGNGALRGTIQKNIALLSPIQVELQKAQQGILREILTSKGLSKIDPNTPEYADYAKQVNEAATRPCEVNLEHIKISDLKLDVNEIPGSVLAVLDPILDK